jgi:Family of unknown function (DUF6191)
MTQWGLDTLFNPAKRHMDEEKQRLEATREEVGDSSGGKRIDLDSGKVTIQRGKRQPTEEQDVVEDLPPADRAALPDEAAEDGAAQDVAAEDTD